MQETQTPAAFTSSGLGQPRAAWEQQHGVPNQTVPGQASYERDKFIVTFWNDVVMTILRQAGNGNALPLAQMQQEARAMLPPDAQLTETHQETSAAGGPHDIVEVYISPSLVDRYPDSPNVGVFPWWEGGPGSIGIIYYGDGHGWSVGAGYST